MAKHTQGPWKAHYDDNLGWTIRGASIDYMGDIGAVCRGNDSERDEADARLMAAAPEMLAALLAVGELLDALANRCTDGVLLTDAFNEECERNPAAAMLHLAITNATPLPTPSI